MDALRSIAAFALGLFLVAAPLAQAKVYKSVLPDGSVVYSDKAPAEGAKEVELPQVQIYQSPPLPLAPAAAAPAAAQESRGYTTFEVASPADDEAVRDNAGSVSISLRIEPALRPGDTVEIFMDGASIGSGGSTSATVTNVDRGTHRLYAVVRSEDGKQLARTADVTFHLLRVSNLQRKTPRAN